MQKWWRRHFVAHLRGSFYAPPHNQSSTFSSISCESFVHIGILSNRGGGTCSCSCPGRDQPSQFSVIIHPFSKSDPFNLYLLFSKWRCRTFRVGQLIQNGIPKLRYGKISVDPGGLECPGVIFKAYIMYILNHCSITVYRCLGPYDRSNILIEHNLKI